MEWKEPPQGTYRKWSKIVDELRANPGSWALIGHMGTSAAYRYARTYGLEIRTANRDAENKYDVYLRAPEVK